MKKSAISCGMLVFLGAFFWSLNAPLVKFIQVDALLTSACRATIAGLFLLPFLRPKKLNWSPWILIYLAAYCGLSVGIVLALRKTSAAIAVGMQYASIVWLFLVNTLMAKHLDRKRMVPVLMISVGVKKTAGDNPLGLTALANLFTGAFVLLFLSPKVTDVLTFGRMEWIIILILGVVQVGLGYAFYNTGVSRTTPQKAAVIALWEMILGPTWVALFLHEYPSLMVCIGFVIIIAGIFVDAKVDAKADAATRLNPGR